MRWLVVEALEGDASKLPSHVMQKTDQRVRSASNKNPALDANLYTTLAGKLEYADLRDLQDTVTNKILRPLFQSTFPNKEVLVKRFDQLAEVRNSIRHSRTVDQVTRKEGEAASLWFQQVLSL